MSFQSSARRERSNPPQASRAQSRDLLSPPSTRQLIGRLHDGISSIRSAPIRQRCNVRIDITDSGGVQEEITYLNIPCLTLRDTTERPITITQGTNRLVRAEHLLARVEAILNGDWNSGWCPELWDGRTASRLVHSLRQHRRRMNYPSLRFYNYSIRSA